MRLTTHVENATLRSVTRSDQIHLELPAIPAYGRVARIAAAHLALRLGFSLHEIDDLRLVMDEAAVMLLGPGVGDGALTVDYQIGDHTIDVDLRLRNESELPLPIERVERFSALVGELVDTYTVDPLERRLQITKTRAKS